MPVLNSLHKTVRLQGRELTYELRRSRRARRLRFTVSPGGRFTVVAPSLLPEAVIQTHLQAKAAWIWSKVDHAKTVMGPSPRRGSKKEFNEHKESARQLVLKRLVELNVPYGFVYQRVTIRNQKTRWGSCSQKGNLNFSYQVALLPAHLRDYILVHELCHLREFNHSRKFWALVARTIPDYQKRRSELRGAARES